MQRPGEGGHLSLLRQSFAQTSETAAAVGRFAGLGDGCVARIAVALLRSSCGAAAEDVQGG
jgi:hypothetical protein